MPLTAMHALVSPILDWLGVDLKTQFTWAVMAYLAAFVVYAIRAKSYGRVFAVLFVLMGLSAFTFLFTELPRVRAGSALLFALACAAAFAWHFHLRRWYARRG